MKLFTRLLIALSFLLYFQPKVFSQQTKDTSDIADLLPKKSYGMAGISFENNSVSFGRQDSVKLAYTTAALGYYDKSGFYASGSLSYLTSSEANRVDLFTLEGGYEYYGDKWQATAGVSKFFYNSNSTNVKSEVKAGFAGSLGYDFGFITPSVLAGLDLLSGNTDYSLSFNLEHTFTAGNLDMTPAILMNAATQNAYGDYYSKKRYAKRKKGGVGPTITADVTDASRFKIRDYELTIPFNYTANKFVFSFTPTYALPVNPATVLVTVKPAIGPAQPTKTIVEKLDNIFFFSLGVSYKF